MKPKNPHAQALGRMKSPAKSKASRENGKLGGRPKSLTDYQKQCLEYASKGYAVEANRHHFTAEQWKERQDLVERGLLRITKPTAWARQGAFVPAKQEGKK